MTRAGLAFMDQMMRDMDIPYSFMEWRSGVPPETHCIGSYMEASTAERAESGRQETVFVLRLYTRGTWTALEEMRERIERNIDRTAILPDGTGIAVFYDSGTPVHLGGPEWRSCKINLKIQEWSVN